MRIRNRRKALEDKTPSRNSPLLSKSLRIDKERFLSSVKPLAAPKFTGGQHQSEDATQSLPVTTDVATTEPTHDVLASPSFLAKAKASGPIQSTPLGLQRRRARLPTRRPPSTSVKPSQRAMSPLPPSSPPSTSSVDFRFTTDHVLPAVPDDNEEEDEDKENVATEKVQNEEPEEENNQDENEEQSSDDPFGFLAVEKKLKAERARTGASKSVARSSREPLGLLELAPEESSSAYPYSQHRPPTPYRDESDDEDLYLDIRADDYKENARVPTFEQPHWSDAGEEDEEVEDKENAHVQPGASASSTGYTDPLRTPHPQHVSALRLPISSPFSSRSTPCDRNLGVESTPSSPSPSKPLSFPQPLRHPRISRTPLPQPQDAQISEKARGKRKAVEVDSDSELDGVVEVEVRKVENKRPRITRKKENEAVALVDKKKSERRLLERSTRLTTRSAAPASKNAATAKKLTTAKTKVTKAANGKGKAKAVDADSGSESDDESDDDTHDAAVTVGKRKATVKANRKQPAKKKKAKAVSTTTSRPGRKPAAKPKMSAKAKGKQKAGAAAYVDEDEDEEAERARRERIEYFRKLDEDYSLEKENVYVI